MVVNSKPERCAENAGAIQRHRTPVEAVEPRSIGKHPSPSDLDAEFQTMCLANARRPCRNFPRKNTLLNSCKESVIISRQGFTDFSGEQPQLSPTGLCMNYKGEVPETGF